MNILLTNDDGIAARGIHLLAEAFTGMDGVQLYICAPDGERSSIGQGMTVKNDIIMEDWPLSDYKGPVVWAKSCSGTPADCVRMGQYLLGLDGVKIDLVCSGINHGGNAGTDTNQSGTVAACREAATAGIPTIAFSSSRGISCGENFFKVVPDVVKKTAGKLPPRTILNVNMRDLPWEEIKGYRAAKLADMAHACNYHPVESDDGKAHYRFSGFTLPPPDKDPQTDRSLTDGGYISVSILPILPEVAQFSHLVEELLK